MHTLAHRTTRPFTAACLCVALLGASVARASDAQAPAAMGDVVSEAVTPVLKDQPAPRSGLLVTERQFQVYLAQQNRADELAAKLKLREQSWQDAEKRAARGWFEQHGFLIGLAVGVIATGVVVWQVGELTKAKQ